ITVSPDSTVSAAMEPPARGQKRTVPQLQFELLRDRPYRLDYGDLLFEVHVRHKELPAADLAANGPAIRDELLGKSHPCMRSSQLVKRYGWGVHFDADGRMALIGLGTDEYREFARGERTDVK